MRNIAIRMIAVAGLAVLASLPAARATVWNVHPGRRIAAAVNAAQPFDTVLIHDGEYQETIIPYGKTLTIGSEYLTDGDSSHIAWFTGNDFTLRLYNLLGGEVATVCAGATTGSEIAYKAPAALASGVYFLRAADRNAVQTKKVVLLK